MKLSHSSVNRYTDCAKSWELHYKEKLRSKVMSSALLFGTAIDKATETYLLTKDKTKTLNEFYKIWDEQEINGQPTRLSNCTKIVYANSDYDSDLLSSDDISYLGVHYSITDSLEEIESIYSQKDVIGFDMLSKERKQLLNNANWLCLRRKGELMIEEAARILDANVEAVHGAQVPVKLINETGDEITGFADAVVDWKGYGQPIIIDFKTSTRLYDSDAVEKSHQLALYVNGLSENYKNTRFGGYVVLHKGIKKNKLKVCNKCGFDGSSTRHKTCINEVDSKRCNGDYKETIRPEATSQVLIGTVPARLEEIVMENMEAVNSLIKVGIFPRNLQSCEKPWGKCDFYEVCHANKFDKVSKKEDK